MTTPIHACSCETLLLLLMLSKLISGSKSCLDVIYIYSKQSTLSFKYYITLPEGIPVMSMEKASQCNFMKVQEMDFSPAEE